MNSIDHSMPPFRPDPGDSGNEQLVMTLKDQLDTMIRQQKLIDDLTASLHSTCVTVNDLCSLLYSLVDSFDAGDKKAVDLQLQKISDQRNSFQKAKVH